MSPSPEHTHLLHVGINGGAPLITDGDPYLVRGRSRETGQSIEICVLHATDEIDAMRRAMTTYRDARGRIHPSALLSAEYAKAIPTPDPHIPTPAPYVPSRISLCPRCGKEKATRYGRPGTLCGGCASAKGAKTRESNGYGFKSEFRA